MRLIKTFGLTAIAAAAAMAFVGASTASADFNTLACAGHTSLSCNTPLNLLHMRNLNGTMVTLDFGGFAPLVLCLLGLALPHFLGLGAAAAGQTVHLLNAGDLDFRECGTNTAHDNCTITATETGTAHLLKTGLDEGSLDFLNGEIFVACFGVECEYNFATLLIQAKNSHLTANETVLNKLDGFSCPATTKLSFLLGPLATEVFHIVS